MKDKIKELQDYFKAKIINGEFEVISNDMYTTTILIDEFTFIIWTANGSNSIETYNYGLNNNLNVVQLYFDENESKKAWIVLSPIVKKHKKDVLIKQKKKELEQLLKDVN